MNVRNPKVTQRSLHRPVRSAFEDGPQSNRDTWSHVILVLVLCLYGLVAIVAAGGFGR